MHARMLLYSGKAQEAEQEMRQVVAQNPDQFKALAYFGGVLYYEGKLDEAKRIWTAPFYSLATQATGPRSRWQVFFMHRAASGKRSTAEYSGTVPNSSSMAMPPTGWAGSTPCSVTGRTHFIA